MGPLLKNFLRDLLIALIQVFLFSICFIISLVVYVGLTLHNLGSRLAGNSPSNTRRHAICQRQYSIGMLPSPPTRLAPLATRGKSNFSRPLSMSVGDRYPNINRSKAQPPLQTALPRTSDCVFKSPCNVLHSAGDSYNNTVNTGILDPFPDNTAIMEGLGFDTGDVSSTFQDTKWQDRQLPTELELLQENTLSEISMIVKVSLIHASALRSSRLKKEKGKAQPLVTSAFGSDDTCHLTSNPWILDDEGMSEASRNRNDSTCSGTTLTSESSSNSGKNSAVSSSTSIDTNPASVSWKETLQVNPNTVVPGTMGFPSSAFINTSPRSSSEHVKNSRPSIFKKSYLRPKTSAMPEKKELKECASCFDDISETKAVGLGCQHSYCGECFSRLVSTAAANEHLFPPQCCLINVPQKTIIKNVDNTVLGAYRRAIKEYEVPAEDRWFCANLKCAKWFDASKLEKRDHNLKCPTCKTRMCRVCRGISHKNQEDCPPNKELEATLETVHLQGWVRCRQCHAAIEKKDGCLHITCRCKAQFCYTCLAPWRTCSCTTDDELRRQSKLAHQRELMEQTSQTEKNKEREWNEELNRALEASEESEKRRQEALEAQIAEDIRRIEQIEAGRKVRVVAYYLNLRRQMYLLHQFQRDTLVQRQDVVMSEPVDLQRIEKAERELAVSISVFHANEREQLENELRNRRQRWADEFLETMTRHSSAQSELIGNFWEETLFMNNPPCASSAQRPENPDDWIKGGDPLPSATSSASTDQSIATLSQPSASDPTAILDAAEQLQTRLRVLAEAQHCEKTFMRECLARDEDKLKARIARTRLSSELAERQQTLLRERTEAERAAKERMERLRAEQMWFDLVLKERMEMLDAEGKGVLESGRDVR